jgi:hypothetical protein
MRISIYIACLLAGIGALPFVVFMGNASGEILMQLVSQSWFTLNPVTQGIIDFLLLFATWLVVFGVVGMLVGELTIFMALLLAAWPLYNGIMLPVGTLIDSRLTPNEIFYADSINQLSSFGGFHQAILLLLSVLSAWWLVQKLLRVAGISSVSV